MSQSDIPRTKVKRSFLAGKTAGKIIGKTIVKKTKDLLRNREEKLNADAKFKDDNAKLIFQALSQLRGTSIKLAQLLAGEMELIPEYIRKELEKSYHKVPPINKALVRKILINKFGDYKTLFKTFDLSSFSAASLGQVHRANNIDDKPLAVKIQYPGINETIESDLKILKYVFKSVEELRKSDDIIEELREQLLLETDYELEAKNILFFKKNLVHNNIIIPEVYPEISNKSILSMEYCEGTAILDWIKNSSPEQEEIDKIANTLYEIFLTSLYKFKKIHSDPNPGNFLVSKDNKLILLDFGSTKSFSSDFLEMYKEIPDTIVKSDKIKYRDLLIDFGMLKTNDLNRINEIVDHIFPFSKQVSEFYKNDYYDFGGDSEFFKMGYKMMTEMRRFKKDIKMNPEFLFLDRTRYGLFRLFNSLGAKVKIKNKYEIKE